MRVETFLRDSAHRFPDKTALVAGPVRLTYADLDDKTDRLAATLQELGVVRGDRVLVFMDNVAEAAIAIFAVLKAGAAFVPVNASTKAEKLTAIVDNCEPSAIITRTPLAAVTALALGDRDIDVLVAGTPEFHAAIVDPPPLLEPQGEVDDLAMLIYTSGSTGVPKGVMMTHRNMDASASAINEYLGNTADDVIFNVLPLAFNYGLYQLLTAIKAGATLVLEKSFAFPAAEFEVMARERVTAFPLVPTIAALLLQQSELPDAAFAHLRYMTNAAAPLPAAHVARLRELLPAVDFYSMYGQTECTRATYLPPAEIDSRPGSVGIAIPGSRAWVVDSQGHHAPPGATGELVIRGPNVMQGYWQNPLASARAVRADRDTGQQVLFTGDLFYADEDGFLYFVSRRDDIIKTRGEKVAPREVETTLHAIPGVAEAVVLGVPDAVLGQAIKAIVVRSDPALTEQQVLRACARALEDFMVPKSVEFRTSLPKTESGKVSRRLVRQSLEPVV